MEVYDGIESCRQSGEVNMCETSNVIRWFIETAEELQLKKEAGRDVPEDVDELMDTYWITAGWIQANPMDYGEGVLLGGFTVVEDVEEVDVAGNLGFDEDDEVSQYINESANEGRGETVYGRNYETR